MSTRLEKNAVISKYCARIALLGFGYCLVFGPKATVLLWFVVMPFVAALILAPYSGYVLLALLWRR